MQPVFIGDELTAAAYRLAGCDVRVTTSAASLTAWRRALDEAPPMVLITAACAAALPADALDAALMLCDPPVVIVPDAAAGVPLPDYTVRVRASLGIGA